jgi:hypothetical protein
MRRKWRAPPGIPSRKRRAIAYPATPIAALRALTDQAVGDGGCGEPRLPLRDATLKLLSNSFRQLKLTLRNWTSSYYREV